MVLEASFLCIDNSDYMRNGDHAPSRMEAQLDAVNLLSGAKTQSNPENVVGLLSTGGKGVEVHVALTSDIGKVLSLSHGIKIGGKANLSAGIQVAQLSLKHRQNKNQRQRIILFVGSPIHEDEAALVKLGKKLKKNSVAMDIINFGEEAENAAKLEALLNAVNSDDNSHLVTVPPGPHVLSDILLSSPIVQGEDGTGVAMGGGIGAAGRDGGGEFAGLGVDPNMDPEFAWALRVSMEEERARQEAAAKKAAEEAAVGEGALVAGAEGGSSQASAAAPTSADGMMDEAAMLEQALAMSMPSSEVKTPAVTAPATTPSAPGGSTSTPAPPTAPPSAVPAPAFDAEMADVGDEDEAMQLALAMSMSQGQAASAPVPTNAPASTADMSAVFQDTSFLQSVLGSLPGVDPNDPRIQSVLNAHKQDGEKGGEEQEEEKK
uniref:26S proteasome regulatory subunit RPN10 n=1 Tax=Strombidinopsis acuminata TaxID=141414 RepID=A0A7S3T0F7_9SPIT|mmetsp:Transcript_19686/g.59711  ORF Transcript_19686/g.59711 Transcript_19686/m.59711 type:complete len:433 (+) Transcript_19686:124-1422(+)|eukprot:scaffold138178_cov30-Tisochrysis_lutea.AAC.1